MAQRNVTGRPLTHGNLARISNFQVSGIFPFQFNPSEIRRTIAADWQFASSPGSEAPLAVFNSTRAQEITLTLLLDARENYDDSKQGVMAQLAYLESMVTPDPDSYIASPSLQVAPSEYRLTIGPRTWPVVCDSISVEEKMWNRDLVPVRAEVTLNLRTINAGQGSVYVAMQALSTSRFRVES